MISALEKDIGTPLFMRTTRAVTLTEAGTDFVARIEPILVALDEAEQAARGAHELHGVLRVGLSSSFALRELVPVLPTFMEHHPALKLELLTDDYRQDLVTEGVDVAFRFGALADSTAVARRVASWPRVVVASPAYLAKRGVPLTPGCLAKHDVIVGPARQGRAWTFTRDGKVTSVRVDGRLTATMTEAVIRAAVEGLGVASAAVRGFQPELRSGALVRLLAEWQMETLDLHAVFAAGRAAKPAARALAAYITDYYAGLSAAEAAI